MTEDKINQSKKGISFKDYARKNKVRNKVDYVQTLVRLVTMTKYNADGKKFQLILRYQT